MSDKIITYSSNGDGDGDEELVSGRNHPVDQQPEILSLRPIHLVDYVGQAEVVETLKIALEAAKLREEPIDHVLFHG